MRLSLLRLTTAFGVAVFALTEFLGAFDLIRRAPLAAGWLILLGSALAAAVARRKQVRIRFPSFDPLVLACAIACIAILAVTCITAVASPPNSADAMAYHMPRVVYWAEQGSVRFFPTPYLNQIMLQPFAEYVMLHLYVLSSGDRLINLVQWFSSAISIIAVSLAAGLFGSTARGQAVAALFCATLPSGILASSGAKNDYVLAMWMVISVCFVLRFARTFLFADAFFLGCAAGLALLTKAPAYLFLPWLLLALWFARRIPLSRRVLLRVATALACALAINVPHYARNYSLSGSVMGFDSAQANGFFRWRNESFGWRETASNMTRNLSEQLGARSERWNRGVYDISLKIHNWIGIDANDPATTWRGSSFRPPRSANHEADAPNRWHLLVLCLIGCVIAWRVAHGRERERALYAGALLCGFVTFCAYLKWQPFMARLLLPLFVASAPLAGLLGDFRPRVVATVIQICLCVLLLDNARLPALQNWTRPLKGPSSVFRISRNDRYFADMQPWNNRDSFYESANLITGARCGMVGIDINNFQLEYPLMALIREHQPGARFLHTGVANPSRRYPPPVESPPCAIACMDCAGDPTRLDLYRDFPRRTSFGKFVVLQR